MTKYDPNGKLSPNFELDEFVRVEDLDNLPAPVYENLKRLSQRLEFIRQQLGNRPIRINSGYRTEAHNRRVGGSPNSFHLKGLAADIVVAGVEPKQVQRALSTWWPGGLGKYPTFTHVDLGPKRTW